MLSGIRVLDISRLLPGPAATWFLAAHGALVDRVETPKGDLTRHLPPFVEGMGAYFSAVSWGKRSLCLDFHHPQIATCLKQILGSYDVFVEGFRPLVLESIGLEPEELLRLHPSLIIVRLSGYGQKGGYSQRVGHDINYIAEVGILGGQKVDEQGHALPSVQIADMAGAMQACMQIAMALFAREKTGKGRVLDISLTESALAMYAPMLTGLMALGRAAKEGGELLSGGASWYGTYRCSDDRYVAVGAVEKKFQDALKQRAGGLHREALNSMFASNTQDFWVEYFEGACVSAVRVGTEIQNSPWLISQQLRQGNQFRAPGGVFLSEPPSLGAHNTEILLEAGVSNEQIAEWKEMGLLCS